MILDNVHSRVFPISTLQYSFDPSQSIPSCITWSSTVHQLFARPAPSLGAHERLPQCTADAGDAPLPGPAREAKTRPSDTDDSVLATLLAFLLVFSLLLLSLLLFPLSLFSFFWLRSTPPPLGPLQTPDERTHTTPLHLLITSSKSIPETMRLGPPRQCRMLWK